MSYILDALKKADAQRERDPARGIHAQPAALAPARRPSDAPSPWVWAGGAALVVLVAGGTWFVAQERSAAPAAVVAQRSAGPAAAGPGPRAFPAVAPPPVLAQPVASSAPVGSAAPAAPVATAVLPPPEPARVAEGEEEGDAMRSPRRRQRVAARSAAAAAAASASASNARTATAAREPASNAAAVVSAPLKTATAAATPATAEAAPIAAGLPPDAPKLAISGGVYSSSRAQRMLIVNGQVVNEGADLGAGVVLEEIKPKSAVLRFRGSRYRVAF